MKFEEHVDYLVDVRLGMKLFVIEIERYELWIIFLKFDSFRVIKIYILVIQSHFFQFYLITNFHIFLNYNILRLDYGIIVWLFGKFSNSSVRY